MSGAILTQSSGPVARLIVSNPAKLNAMSLDMWRALREATLRLEADPAVRVLVLTGEGGRAFVSGADISGFADHRSPGAAAADYDAAVQGAQAALAACSKPTVARIAGVCMGGGIGLALACDLRYASASARLRMPAARLGLGYALPAMAQFVGAVGAAPAMDLFLTARTFDGLEARRLGVVHDAFEDAQFERLFDERVREIAANAPLTLRAAKAAIRECVQPQGPAHRARIDAWVRACFESADYAEGQRAFAQRRAPLFTGT